MFFLNFGSLSSVELKEVWNYQKKKNGTEASDLVACATRNDMATARVCQLRGILKPHCASGQQRVKLCQH